MANSFYYTILDADVESLHDYIKPTVIADSIKALIADKNLHNVYVYVDGELTNAKHSLITNFFAYNPKITMVTGDKLSFLKEYPADVYLFKNLADIELLKMTDNTSPERTVEVLCYDIPVNSRLWEASKEDSGLHDELVDTFGISVNFCNNI